MNKNKAYIIALLWGVPQGYVKSISYQYGTFKVTKEKINAKGYTSEDKIQSDIDFLTKFNNSLGYIFIYE